MTSCSVPVAETEPAPATTAATPVEREINIVCIKAELDDSWHLDKVIRDWNRNSSVAIYSKPLCEGDPDVTISTDNRALDGTLDARTYFYGTFIVIKLSENIIPRYRRNLLCHELGHALGRPHVNRDDSCMEKRPNHARPSDEDLTEVSKILKWSPCLAEKLAYEVDSC